MGIKAVSFYSVSSILQRSIFSKQYVWNQFSHGNITSKIHVLLKAKFTVKHIEIKENICFIQMYSTFSGEVKN